MIGEALALETRAAATERRGDAVVLVIGTWHAAWAGWRHSGPSGLTVESCAPGVETLPRRLRVGDSRIWLLVGEGLDEDHALTLARSARTSRPDSKLAVIGPSNDTARSRRWIRIGCSVYLASSSSRQRVLSAIDVAERLGAMIVDRCFQEQTVAGNGVTIPNLTSREEEIAQLMCQGLRNADMARRLHITESTVEYHVRKLFDKLCARNRAELVARILARGIP